MEYAVVGGLLALGTLAVAGFVKLFPIVPVDLDDEHAPRAPRSSGVMRSACGLVGDRSTTSGSRDRTATHGVQLR